MSDEIEFHPVAEIFPMMSAREFDDLVDDIAEHGLREPVWLHRDGRIVDGRNRYRACAKAGISPSFRTYEGDDSGLVAFVLSLNLHRRHLNESQRSMVAARIAGYGHGGDRVSEQAENLPLATQAEAAELLSISDRSIRSARKVQEHGSRELIQAVDRGDLSVSAAAAVATEPEHVQHEVVEAFTDPDADDLRVMAARHKIRRARERRPEPIPEPVPPPRGKYRCVVLDPPWPMEKIEREERPSQGDVLDYPTMTLDQLADENWLPVRTLADDDCHIYLWVTHRFLPAGMGLLATWGFNYQCVMTWRKNVGITPFSWMYDTEHVLFGRRGNLKLERLGLRLSFEAPVNGHSVKPDVFYERVREASPGPRIDMFPGVEHEGFEPWGLEATHRGDL